MLPRGFTLAHVPVYKAGNNMLHFTAVGTLKKNSFDQSLLNTVCWRGEKVLRQCQCGVRTLSDLDEADNDDEG